MTEQALFTILRQSADGPVVDAMERAVRDAPDAALNRINALAFASKEGLDEERTIAAFLHASRLGIFEISWNVLCPGCGGVLDAGSSLKTIQQPSYSCALCGAGYEPTLDEMVEVTFTVTPRIRKIAGHDPDSSADVGLRAPVLLGVGSRFARGLRGDRRGDRPRFRWNCRRANGHLCRSSFRPNSSSCSTPSPIRRSSST